MEVPMIKIGVDANGGDNGVATTVPAAMMAVKGIVKELLLFILQKPYLWARRILFVR